MKLKTKTDPFIAVSSCGIDVILNLSKHNLDALALFWSAVGLKDYQNELSIKDLKRKFKRPRARFYNALELLLAHGIITREDDDRVALNFTYVF